MPYAFFPGMSASCLGRVKTQLQWIALVAPVIEAFRHQRELTTISPFNEPFHRSPSHSGIRIITGSIILSSQGSFTRVPAPTSLAEVPLIADLVATREEAIDEYAADDRSSDHATLCNAPFAKVSLVASGPFLPVGVRQLTGELQPVSHFVL